MSVQFVVLWKKKVRDENAKYEYKRYKGEPLKEIVIKEGWIIY